jgi:lipid-binding SYLF domain-containing protein
MPYTILILVFSLWLSPPAAADWNPFNKEKRQEEDTKVSEIIAAFKRKDSNLEKFFTEAYGYAVFPTVGKAGVGIGGAYGKGEVYQKGKRIGTAALKQISIGFQLGGQAYSEILFFKDKETLDAFTRDTYELSAQASAVAVKAGASTQAVYDNGLAIFTMAKGGLMYEATVAGQKFSYDASKEND